MTRRNSLLANIDWLTVIIFFLLVFLGWINIYAAVYNDEFNNIFDLSQRYGKQLLWIGAAIVLAIFTLVVEARFYVFFAYPIYGLFVFLLVLVLVFGTEINGAKSWFLISGFSFQPSEFAKFATALALAKYFSSYNFKLQGFKSFAIIGLILLLPALFIFLQNDTGSALVYFAFILVLFREGLSIVASFFIVWIGLLFVLSLILSNLFLVLFLAFISLIIYYVLNPKIKDFGKVLFLVLGIIGVVWVVSEIVNFNINIATVISVGTVISSLFFLFITIRKRLNKLIILILVFLGSLMFTFSVDYGFKNLLNQYQQDRINLTLGIETDPLGKGYNVNQSKIAIGSGGVTGKGFLKGTQTKFNFVPEQSTDFIFCTVGEEWGFIGSSLVVILFLVLFSRLIIMAERQRSLFSRVYGYSVVSILFFHFAINIGMTIGLMPVIGIPLPFFSYGGSSLWSFTLLLSIFLRLDASRLEVIS